MKSVVRYINAEKDWVKFCSSISAEWRAVIINGKKSEICCYLPDKINTNIPDTLTEFCNKCISKAPDLIAWVMDIAESNNNYYVLECNIFNASNFYDCNRRKIVVDLENAISQEAVMTYESILDFWKKQNIKNANKLASVLSSYSVNFAYNSGKTENDEITSKQKLFRINI